MVLGLYEHREGRPRVPGYRPLGDGHAAESPDCSIQLGGVVRGVAWHTPVGYCKAEQSNHQAHPSRVRRLSHFQRSCDPRDQGEHALSN
jgi:hypothetical protein